MSRGKEIHIMNNDRLLNFAFYVKTETEKRHGSTMIHKDLPLVLFVKPEEFLNISCSQNENVLYLLAKDNLGLAVRDSWVKEFIVKQGLSDKYPDGTIFVFNHGNDDDEILESILCHELMHYFFKGIPNDDRDGKGQGYNEACTDFLAREIYGDNYFSSYEQMTDPNCPSYMKFYKEFKEGGEIMKKEILKEYFGN